MKMSETALNYTLAICAVLGIIGTAGATWVGLIKSNRLTKEKEAAKEQRKLDSLAAELQRQDDKNELRRQHQEITALQRDNKRLTDANHQANIKHQDFIAFATAQRDEENRRWTEERMTEAKSSPYLILAANANNEMALYWQNPGEDAATVMFGFYHVEWTGDDGYTQTRWKELEQSSVPPDSRGSEAPRVLIDLPNTYETQLSIKFHTRKGTFFEDMFLMRLDGGYAQAYQVQQAGKEDSPILCFIDPNFDITRANNFQHFTKTWPKVKGKLIRDGYVRPSEMDQ